MIGFQSSNIRKWSYLKADKEIHETYNSHLAKNIPPNLSPLSSDRHLTWIKHMNDRNSLNFYHSYVKFISSPLSFIRMIKMVLILSILVKTRRSSLVDKSMNVDHWLLCNEHSWIYRASFPQPIFEPLLITKQELSVVGNITVNSYT